ncbi:hypothetical protein J7T55_009589 [Diaporthe amygdali]|uniref:uncharacterized protein n=1 Tax=Phomopsis amygdali TaxID=1214568 RepID=UPI0022FE8673|nr:uncharacterized protein J7T55_009589 [Diaporthe amygdali]KAJ0109258.1 hypothetical protein J7T55_009589 [Diaporthe amygdali]
MSADLFAEFGSFNSGTPQQSTQKPALSTPADPFAFLSSPTSHTASPQSFQPPSQPWSTVQNRQSANAGWASFGTSSPAQIATQPPKPEAADDDEGWGDFEEAPSATATQPPVSIPFSAPPVTTAGHATASNLPPMRARITRVDTFDLMANKLVPTAGGKEKSESQQARPSFGATATSSSSLWSSPQTTYQAAEPASKPPVNKVKPKDNNADVLFDADDFDGEAPDDDDDDDFGDFETGFEESRTTVKVPTPAQPAIADLMSLDFGPPSSQPAPALKSGPTHSRKEPPTQLLSTLNIGGPPHSPTSLYPQPPKSPAFSDRNPFPGLSVTTPVSGSFPPELKDDVKKSPDPMTAWPDGESATEKDDWDAFADFPPDASSATPGGEGPSAVSSSWDWNAVEPSQVNRKPSAPKVTPRKSSASESIGPPPTNIPPPSILLSIFTELLEEAETKLYKPTANQPAVVKTRIYADPGTLAFLRGYIVLATVAARILVGRRLRWNRDKFLSQGMSISAAGSKGGMKLAGVDKAQTTRENREAADVIGLWRDYVGKLKTAVAQANIGMQKQPVKMEPLKVPEINDHMAVTTAKMVPTAPKACVICGLKREERVKGVDTEVEDSFGEWWVEHWGHRTCRNFWLGNEEKLRSR